MQAVQDITLHIPKGTTVGIIGTSGAGKTTVLKLICGLLVPDGGRVRVAYRNPVRERRRLSKQISVLFADNSMLHPEKTVFENLDLIKCIYGETKEKCYALMERFQLFPCRNEQVKNLSLGYRRRAELAAVFLQSAELFLLDEPCIGMDVFAREVFEELVKEYRSQGKTILISSHHMGEIDALSQRILFLHEGRMMFYGEREELYGTLAPIRRMRMTFADRVPDMQDIPFLNYVQDDKKLNLIYNSKRVTAAEIIQTLLESSEIEEICMENPSLEEVIAETAKRREMNEAFDRNGAGE